MNHQVLSTNEVLRIHELLCNEFRGTSHNICPEGVRDINLLESAVGKQHTGLGDRLKYPDAYSSAATLTFGICCNHAFHNGNKRTALVALLAHLEKNKLVIKGTNERPINDKELERKIIEIAEHKFAEGFTLKKGHPGREKGHEGEVQAITEWLRINSQRVRRDEKPVTFREFRRILKKFGFELENPKDNLIEVVKYEKRKKWLGRQYNERVHICRMPYPGREGEPVGISVIKKVRANCGLREEDGVPSGSFYGDDQVISAFINRYRNILKRLGNK